MSGSCADHGMAATPEVAKAANGVDDVQTMVKNGHEKPFGEVGDVSVDHAQVATTGAHMARKPSMTGRYALAARTSIPSLVIPSENGVPSVLQTPCTLTTCLRSCFAGATGCGSDRRVSPWHDRVRNNRRDARYV